MAAFATLTREEIRFLFDQMGIIDCAWDNKKIAFLAKKFGLTRDECPVFMPEDEWEKL